MSRRRSNGQSPLVNQQRQITAFFFKSTSSPFPISSKSKQTQNPYPSPISLNSKRSQNPNCSPGPTTPSPLQSKPVSNSKAKKSPGQEVVGKRIKVYWPLDRDWYEGYVKLFNKNSGKHLIQYDSQEEEWLDLEEKEIEWVQETVKTFKRLRRGPLPTSNYVDVDLVTEDEDKEESKDVADYESSDEDWGQSGCKVLVAEVSEEEEELIVLEDDEDNEAPTKARDCPFLLPSSSSRFIRRKSPFLPNPSLSQPQPLSDSPSLSRTSPLTMSSHQLITSSGPHSTSGDHPDESVPPPPIEPVARTAEFAYGPTASAKSVRPSRRSARRLHSKKRGQSCVEPTASEVESSAQLDGDGIIPNVRSKKVRGINKGVKSTRITLTTKEKIQVTYIPELRKASPKVHSLLAADIGAIIRTKCPMVASTFKKLSDEHKTLMWDQLSINFKYDLTDSETAGYIADIWQERYREWKYELHKYYDSCTSPVEAPSDPPIELEGDRLAEWHWLCAHFESPNYLLRSAANKRNRAEKKYNHHGGSRPIAFRIEDRRKQGSLWPELDVWADLNANHGDAEADRIHAEMMEDKEHIQFSLSQQQPDTPLQQLGLPDLGKSLEILDKRLGKRPGRIIRGMGTAQVRDLGTTFSRSSPGANKVDLAEKLTTVQSNFNLLLEALRQAGLPIPPGLQPLTQSEQQPEQ